jgi:hypothetical protein
MAIDQSYLRFGGLVQGAGVVLLIGKRLSYPGVSLTGRAFRSYCTGLSHGPVSAAIANVLLIDQPLNQSTIFRVRDCNVKPTVQRSETRTWREKPGPEGNTKGIIVAI